MALDQFLIAPMTEGLRTDVPSWLIPEQAFAELRNAYVWRGRVRKRFGSKFIQTTAAVTGYEQLNSRLRISKGDTDQAGDIAGIVPGTIFKVGQMFSIGTDLFTVVLAGVNQVMITNGGATTHTYSTTNGAYNIIGSHALTECWFYPAEPVMGFANYEVAAINDEPTYAFDTQFAYHYLATGWERLGTGLWTGSNSQFFWAENYRGANDYTTLLFVTNNSPTDHVRYWSGAAWTTFQPAYNVAGNNIIEGCRIIVSFKNRLLFLNTYESIGGAATQNYPNRVRYSQNGDPTVVATSWLEAPETSGRGGVINAPTREMIISAKILRDRLVVFFEKSTWEIVYTGNQILPFIWQRINSELGAESTFSTVLFDKVLLGVGNVGINACNGANVDRIDDKIPQAVFEIHNGNDGVERVYGIRDYHAEMVYWTLPDQTDDPVYPTRVLVYNYKDRTWAINDDSITCFGYIQNFNDETWSIAAGTWQERIDLWVNPDLQSEYRHVVAGNQEGYTFILDEDSTRNAPALQITQIVNVAGELSLSVIDNNMKAGDFILVENVLGATNFDGIYQVLSATVNVIVVGEPLYGGVYTGGGTITRVSQVDVLTKQFNFYQKQGKNLFIPKVAFYVDRTANGKMSFDYSTSSSNLSLVGEATTSGSLQGTSIIELTPYADVPFEATQDRFWHIMYLQAEGEVIQLRLYLSDALLARLPDSSNKDAIYNIAMSDFQLNGMNIYAKQIHRY